MGPLPGADNRWLESEGDKVVGLIWELFGAEVREGAVGRAGESVAFLYSEETVMEWVHYALAGTLNNSTAGPNGAGYELIRAVRDMRLGREVLSEVVAAHRGSGYIQHRWRDIRVVLIPKPGWDLTQTKNWRPLNLINCVGKLGEKVVADRIQPESHLVLHH